MCSFFIYLNIHNRRRRENRCSPADGTSGASDGSLWRRHARRTVRRYDGIPSGQSVTGDFDAREKDEFKVFELKKLTKLTYAPR